MAMEAIMAGKEISVKTYVVQLSSEERQQLETSGQLLVPEQKGCLGRFAMAVKKRSGEATGDLGPFGVLVPAGEAIERFAEIRRMRVEEGWPGWDTEPLSTADCCRFRAARIDCGRTAWSTQCEETGAAANLAISGIKGAGGAL